MTNRAFIVYTAILLVGCSTYDYAVVKSASGPNGNLASGANEDSYEFRTTIRHDIDGESVDIAELAHLTFYENSHERLFDGVRKSSRLRFWILNNPRIRLAPDSVMIQHFRLEGQIVRPLAVESKLSDCPDQVNCGTFTVRYGHGIPDKVTERVSFTLIVDGIETKIERTYSLERAPNGTLWDSLMGI